MTVNDKNFRKLAMRIGFAMLLFYGMFQTVAYSAVYLQAYLYEIMPHDAAHLVGQSLYGICYFLSFAIPTVVLCKMQKNKIDRRPITFAAGLPRGWIMIIFAAVSINFAVAYINSMIFMPFLPTFSDMASAATNETITPWVQIVMSVFTTAVVPALCEEFLFRGAILTNLTPYGRGYAVLFSAILFGLMHQNLFQIIYTTILGVVLALVYVRTKSLWCCVLVHFVNNGISVLQESLYLVLEERIADMINYSLYLVVLVAGAVSLLVLLTRHGKTERPEDSGSFGKIYPVGMDYEEYPITRGKRVKLFFSPTMIIFTVIAVSSIATTLLSVLLSGALGL